MVIIPDFLLFLIIYTLVNGAVFSLNAHDKVKAKKNAWRTPENLLLFFAFLGPFGACCGMQVYRHKTQKIKFYLVPVFALLHIVIMVGVLISYMK